MGKKENRIYLHAIVRRYRRASRAVKGVILSEFCSVCGYNRKYAVRILNHPPSTSSKRHVGRKPVYRYEEFLMALKRIWFACDQMCSKKLVVAIKLWLPFYDKTFEPLTLETRKKLLTISAARVITAQSFSITTCCTTSRTGQRSFLSLAHDLTKRTTMHMSNRRTGRMCGNCLAMTGSTGMSWFQ